MFLWFLVLAVRLWLVFIKNKIKICITPKIGHFETTWRSRDIDNLPLNAIKIHGEKGKGIGVCGIPIPNGALESLFLIQLGFFKRFTRHGWRRLALGRHMQPSKGHVRWYHDARLLLCGVIVAKGIYYIGHKARQEPQQNIAHALGQESHSHGLGNFTAKVNGPRGLSFQLTLHLPNKDALFLSKQEPCPIRIVFGFGWFDQE
mmetsp:Transcript_19529/g.40458  ORF Transcript_19529/g.40458 Transcript_19529/m.40458 type:complete len:203 (+) Transcript_19529:678-1286(+)